MHFVRLCRSSVWAGRRGEPRWRAGLDGGRRKGGTMARERVGQSEDADGNAEAV